MEQTNYPELNKKKFSDYTADPSALDSGDSKSLETSLEKFPYCQLLHSFYTRSLAVDDPDGFEKHLSKTALFFPDRKVLYTIIEESEKLKSPETDAQTPEGQSIETTEDNTAETEQGGEQVNDIHSVQNEDTVEEIATQQVQGTSAEIAEDTVLSDGSESEDAAILIENILSEKNRDAPEVGSSSPENDELDTLIKENVVPVDYLAEEKIKESESEQPEQEAQIEHADDVKTQEAISETPNEPGDQKVSKYDDDKLPYSFLWWLSKTRKEHSDTYQPYVNFILDTSQNIKRNTVDQLSSQIIENIFHLQSPVDLLENSPTTIPFQVKRKEDFILEKFIKEDPQIKAPDSQKLDTENKARKSAEDPNDLVSETLAHIYTDQMLFHKAIDTYKKLSLKFPEKSTYFADQIRELEKKVN